MDQRLFVHNKTRKYYVIITDDVYIEATNERAVAYTRLQPSKDESTNKVWVRPHKEFFDGRFKKIRLKEG